MKKSFTPILVGCGQVTQREEDPKIALSPLDLTAKACFEAADDTNIGKNIFNKLDTIILIRSFSDTSWRFKCPFGNSNNPPKSLANRLKADKAKLIYSLPGGNMPQWSINRLSEMISSGEIEIALLAGGEALNTQKNAKRKKINLNWKETINDTNYLSWGVNKPGWTKTEELHHMNGAIYAYPMIENALRGYLGHNINEHMDYMGELFSKFSTIASKNPLADRRQKFSNKDISTVSKNNPFIGFPYTKLMNSNAYIDQSSAIILTSVEKAKELSIPRNKWVYLHGCADAFDHWYMSERKNFYSSPAMSIVAREALEMAETSIKEMDYIDLYSCFPSAIEIACKEMNISINDPRGLTVTGGLPYFGGPGNNYVTHSISEMMTILRKNQDKMGLITANGNYITKQSIGIYSTKPLEKEFKIKSPDIYQKEIDKDKGPNFSVIANGKANIETYTVMFDREGPIFSILFGRLSDGKRFIANTINDRNLLNEMTKIDYLNASGYVKNKNGKNTFIPD